MARRVRVQAEYTGRVPESFEEWDLEGGEIVALSGSTETRRIRLAGLDLHVKRHRYSPRAALRAALRNTWLWPSRAAREFQMLAAFRALAGPDVAPAPVALGEERVLGLLRSSFLATATVLGARPLDRQTPEGRDAARRLGRFLASIHGAGLSHGRLFARNLLVTDTGFAVVDLDRARSVGTGRRPSEAARARDLAFLDESVPGVSPRDRLRTLRDYLGGRPSGPERRRLLAAIERWRPEARRRLSRRARAG
ncbi:MAG: lipopolysaccharide kinase InaA family protein [Planctomycetota bacterium]|jgi:tRNA A-37 threonylcarbamoyl transferase component Bud32